MATSRVRITEPTLSLVPTTSSTTCQLLISTNCLSNYFDVPGTSTHLHGLDPVEADLFWRLSKFFDVPGTSTDLHVLDPVEADLLWCLSKFFDVSVTSTHPNVLDPVETDLFCCLSKFLGGIQDSYIFAQPSIVQ